MSDIFSWFKFWASQLLQMFLNKNKKILKNVVNQETTTYLYHSELTLGIGSVPKSMWYVLVS